MPQQQDPDLEHEAVEVDMVVTPSGRLCLPGNQQIKFNAALGGHPVTVWADLRSIHVLLGGELIRTRASRPTWPGCGYKEPGPQAPSPFPQPPRADQSRPLQRSRSNGPWAATAISNSPDTASSWR